ncbi:hypothetical protein PFWH6_4509 [Pseudomonas fluorescens WH6]|nr:hypothetical protein PFWH6_4509 [Pseudomonas fluorescens WH6]
MPDKKPSFEGFFYLSIDSSANSHRPASRKLTTIGWNAFDLFRHPSCLGPLSLC